MSSCDHEDFAFLLQLGEFVVGFLLKVISG
jgi:hypothetical protein